MKRTLNLIPLALLCTMLLTGFTPKRVLTDVDLYISLPWTGNYNDWTITFYQKYGPESYTFYTNDDTWDDGYLGTIPEGVYNIEFNSGYSGSFEFGVDGPNFYHYMGGTGYTWYYSAPIEPGTVIHID
jgi:hypothetical protein